MRLPSFSSLFLSCFLLFYPFFKIYGISRSEEGLWQKVVSYVHETPNMTSSFIQYNPDNSHLKGIAYIDLQNRKMRLQYNTAKPIVFLAVNDNLIIADEGMESLSYVKIKQLPIGALFIALKSNNVTFRRQIFLEKIGDEILVHWKKEFFLRFKENASGNLSFTGWDIENHGKSKNILVRFAPWTPTPSYTNLYNYTPPWNIVKQH